MQVHNVRPVHARRARKRIGRGKGSGDGNYAGKGMKGQNSRSGGGVRPGFEGGQNPQIKGLPKLRGFHNRFRIEYQVVNLDKLSELPAGVTDVTHQVLAEHGMVRQAKGLVKVLGAGEVNRKLSVVASRFSQSARSKIEAAGGEILETAPLKVRTAGKKKDRADARAAKVVPVELEPATAEDEKAEDEKA
jgi:large subunit ribosomal protein L15